MARTIDATETARLAIASDTGEGRGGECGGITEALVGVAEVAWDGSDGVGGEGGGDAEALGVARGRAAQDTGGGLGG